MTSMMNQHQNDQSDPDFSGASTAALVLGILSLVAWLLPILGLPVSAAGLGLGVAGRQSGRRRRAIAAIVLASLGLALTILNAGVATYQAYLGASGGR
jgi:hypothetical protein